MKHLAKIFSFITRAVVALGFIALTASGVLLVSYFFGAAVLGRNTVLGSDNTLHLSLIHVLNRFWPRIPLWFQYAGSGSSLVLGYWIASYYAILKLAHSSTLNIEQSLRFIQFLTIPIVAFELYLFGWLRLKNHVIGLIAALLYPISSIAWGWIAHAGFCSMHVSLTMVIPALIFYDAYLENILEGPSLKGRSFETLKRRLNLLGTGIFIAASLVAHLAAGASLLLGLPVYTLVKSLFKPKEGLLKGFLRGVGAFLTAVMVGAGISAFLFLPQRRYFAFQAQDFTPFYSPQDFPYLPWKGFLGLERLMNVGSLYTPLFLSKIVTLMGFLGIALGLILRSSAGALGVTALFFVFWMSQAPFLSARFPFLNTFLLPTNLRVSSIPGALFPLLAGYGVYTLIDLPGRGIRFLVRKIAWLKLLAAPITLTIAAIPAILLTGYLVYEHRSWQEYPPTTDDTGNVMEGYSGYGGLGIRPPLCVVPGWEGVGVPKISTCEKITPPAIASLLSKRPINPFQLIKEVEIKLTGRDPLYEMEFDEKMAPLALDEGTRISISSHLGAFMQAFNKHTKASMINSPAGTSVVNLSWWGVQDQAFYQPGETTPQEISEIAKWFGIKYVFLHLGDDKDYLYRYPSEEWPDVELLGNTIQMKEFKSSPGMAVVSNKPAVLVIGSQEKRAYESVFRGAVKGALSYDEAILIQGTGRIDDYSLEELRQFQVLILQGYSYRNRNKAWNLLRQFVEGGGGLFIDTGWQYAAKDWSTKKTGDRDDPVYVAELREPFPITKTTWGDVGGSWEGFELDLEASESPGNPTVAATHMSRAQSRGASPESKAGHAPQLPDLSEFGSLSWEDKPWSLAYADKSDLAPWAEPVLYNDDNVLVARGSPSFAPSSAKAKGGKKASEGKIVWSGMNLFSHAYDKGSAAEYQFIGNLLDFLLSSHPEFISGSGTSESPQPSGFRNEFGMTDRQAEINRPFPDQVTLSTGPANEGEWLYWAESYTPDWKAYLVSDGKKERLKILRAGSGFQAIRLPKMSQGGKVVLEYDLKRFFIISFGVTILTFLIIVITILDPLLFKSQLEKRIQGVFVERTKSLIALSKDKIFKTLAHEEDEY